MARELDKDQLIREMAVGKYPTVEIKAGKFKEPFIIKYLSGDEMSAVGRKLSEYFGGQNLESIPAENYYTAKQGMYLNFAVKEYPKDFEGVWKKEDFINYPDMEVKNELFKSFNTFFIEVQNTLSGNKSK